MNFNKMYSADELSKLITQGKTFFVAGDEDALKKLPKGQWIGGTIPYFMADSGGLVTKEKIFATELPSYIKGIHIKSYDESNIKNVYKDAPSNGFSMIIIPALTKMHLSFANNAPEYAEFASRPLLGWISGINLKDLGKISPKVFNGQSGEISESKAIVMQVELTENYVSEIGIVNIFEQGQGDVIEFLEGGFSAKEVKVNGEKVNFADYCKKKNLDVRLPLVANYAGAMINVSFQNVDQENKKVDFYAPVFTGVQYKQAGAVKDYVKSFTDSLPKNSDQILFSCNCILNFLHSELEGKKTANITGPITFGEVAYQLLNQTMVYLNIQKI